MTFPVILTKTILRAFTPPSNPLIEIQTVIITWSYSWINNNSQLFKRIVVRDRMS